MSDTFSPSLATYARTSGHRVHRAEYTGTTPEQHQKSLTLMAEKIREGRLSPLVRGRASEVLRDAGLDGRNRVTVRQQADAILSYVCGDDTKVGAAIYVPDPVKAEYVQGAVATLCLAPGLCLRGGDCFPQGTLLLRDDFELIRIEDLQVGDRIWGKDRWATVHRKIDKGSLPLDAIRMNNGSTMLLTEDHHVFGLNKEGTETRIRVSDLTVGQLLTQPLRLPFGDDDTLDPDRAYVEGLHASDGWHEAGASRFNISGQDGKPKEAQKREVAAICARLGVNTRWNRKYIAINDRTWADRVALMGHRAPNKRLISLNLGEAQAAQTLRGVMADSAANTNGQGRTFTTTSHALMVQVRVLHRMFGRSTSVRYMTAEQHQGLGQNPIWRVGVRNAVQHADKKLRVKEIDRSVVELPCWDIETSDGYVYLPEHDVTVSNCDDLVVATLSLLSSIGIVVMIIKEDYGANPLTGADYQGHVLGACQDEQGEWFYVDPSTKKGIHKRDNDRVRHRQWIDPLKNAPIEIIGVGRPPTFMDGPVGLGDATPITGVTIPGTWTNVANNAVTAGLRYAVAIIANPTPTASTNGTGSVSDTPVWGASDVQDYFAPNFLVEQVIAGAGTGYWVMIGVARSAQTLAAQGTQANVSAVLQEQPPTATSTTTTTPATASTAVTAAPNVVGVGTVLLVAGGLALAGGVAYGLHKRGFFK